MELLCVIAIISLLLALVFVALTNPVATHALARSALRYGLKPMLQEEWETVQSSGKPDALGT